MPLYERECSACKHTTEDLESIHAEDTIVCPKCGEKTHTKLISKCGFNMDSFMFGKDNVDSGYR